MFGGGGCVNKVIKRLAQSIWAEVALEDNLVQIFNFFISIFKEIHKNWNLGHCSENKYLDCLMVHLISNSKMETCQWTF